MASPMAEQSVAFVNLVLHASYIYLHEAAVTRGQEIGLAPAVIAESEMRCKTAAMEIANIVRLMSPLNILPMVRLSLTLVEARLHLYGRPSREQPQAPW